MTVCSYDGGYAAQSTLIKTPLDFGPTSIIVEIGKHKPTALVDTAAAKSCMPYRVCCCLHAVLTPPLGHLIRMGNEDLGQSLGYSTLSVRIGDNRYTVMFIELPTCIADVTLG